MGDLGDGVQLLFGMVSTVIIYRYTESCCPGSFIGGTKNVPIGHMDPYRKLLQEKLSIGNSYREKSFPIGSKIPIGGQSMDPYRRLPIGTFLSHR
jgi:hypothetical protein